MNRPFPAFAALLALLALAMFAVSSSNRSTTVQPPQPERKTTGTDAPRGQSNFVFVVRAADQEDSRDSRRVDSLLTTVICVEATAYDFTIVRPATRQLKPATIEIADAVHLVTKQMPEVDCRSHYDPVYDAIVYGASSTEIQPIIDIANSLSIRSIPASEVLSIFAEFRTSRQTTTRKEAAIRQPPAHFISADLAARWAAFRAWITYQVGCWAEEMGLALDTSGGHSPELAWNEYADLMDHALSVEIALNTARADSRGTDARTLVRFSDWLWRYAASSSSR